MSQIDYRTLSGMAKLGQGKTSVNFRMSAEARYKLELLALKLGINLGSAVELAIEKMAEQVLPETTCERLECRAEAREQ